MTECAADTSNRWLPVSVLTAVMLCGVPVQGEPTPANTSSTAYSATVSERESGSRTLLQQLAEQGAAQPQLAGQFRQRRQVAGLPFPLVSSGRFYYSESAGIRWHTLQPVDSLVEITAQGISHQQQQAAGSELFAGLVLTLFSGDLQALDRYFSSTATGTVAQWQVVLLPASEAVAQQFVDITLSGSTVTEAIHLRERSGDEIFIELSTERPAELDQNERTVDENEPR